MKLRILGNNGPYPGKNGACSGYLLSNDEGSIHVLIECGTGVLCRLMEALPLEKLDAVILSHLHYDHMSDLLPMQYALQFHPRKPLALYAPETPANVHALLNVPAYELHTIGDFSIGNMHFSFMPVRHPVESHALRVECEGKVFVYTGDTNEIPGLDIFAANADLLLADAGLLIDHWSETAPHLSAQGCARLAAQAKAKHLLLTHLNPRYTPEHLEAEARANFADAQFAHIGMIYDI